MRPRNREAARLEADYLERVHAALAGRDPSEVDEVVASVRDHIEEELSEGGKIGEVSLVDMANVLEHLGPPAAYRSPEESEATPAPAPGPPRMSRKAVAAALWLPVVMAVDGLILLIGEAAGMSEHRLEPILAVIGFAGLLAAVVLSVSALSDIRHSGGRLRGTWLVIAALVLPLVLAFLWFALALAATPARTR